MKVGRTHIGIASLLASASPILATAFIFVVVFAVACLLGSGSSHAQKAYITNGGDNTVSVVDTATNTVTATISGSYLIEPYGVAVSPDGKKAYITDYFSDSVSVIDTATNTVVANINLGFQTFPQGVAVTPDGSKVYVADNATDQNGAVSVIDTATNTVIAGIQTGSRPVGVAVSPDGSKVYVTNHGSNSVSVIDAATNTVTATIVTDSGPEGVVVTPDGKKVYVANHDSLVTDHNGGQSSTVSVIDTATNTVTKNISNDNCGCSFNPTFTYPIGVAVAPDGKRVYVATGYSQDHAMLGYADYYTAVIDTATDTVTAQIYTSSSRIPLGVAVTPDGSKVYVANPGENPNGGPGNNVSVLDLATNTRTALIQTGQYPIAFGNFITPAPAAQTAPPSGTACNGTYNGTFTGNITVSAGQSCMFISGGKITGNVSVAGGSFGLNGAAVGSNLTINAGSFALTGARIGGNLAVVGILPNTASNSVCGTTVLGNLKFDNNGTSVQIGSATPSSCAGNTIDGSFEALSNTNSTLIFSNSVGSNMAVNNNTGPTDVVGNNVSGTLQCLNNTQLIMGSGNTAKKKSGQCS